MVRRDREVFTLRCDINPRILRFILHSIPSIPSDKSASPSTLSLLLLPPRPSLHQNFSLLSKHNYQTSILASLSLLPLQQRLGNGQRKQTPLIKHVAGNNRDRQHHHYRAYFAVRRSVLLREVGGGQRFWDLLWFGCW